MKISEIITDKYKLRIPPTVYYDLLADVREMEEEQEPKTGYWIATGDYYTGAYGSIDYVECSCCHYESLEEGDFCPNCGAKMVEPQESENT